TAVVSVAWREDGTVVSSGRNFAHWVWGTDGKESQRHLATDTACWSADHKALAYKSAERQVTIWEPDADKKRTLDLKDIKGGIGCLALSPDGKFLANSGGGMVYCWDALSGKQLFSGPGQKRTTQLYFSLDGKWLASRVENGFGCGLLWPAD